MYGVIIIFLSARRDVQEELGKGGARVTVVVANAERCSTPGQVSRGEEVTDGTAVTRRGGHDETRGNERRGSCCRYSTERGVWRETSSSSLGLFRGFFLPIKWRRVTRGGRAA